MKVYDVAVIGGGLAGLTAACDLARAGKSVAVLEKSGRIGGQAMTVEKNGASFNLGVHAIYRGGAAERILQQLGVKLEGGKPSNKGFMLWDNELIASPADPVSIFSSRFFSWSGKMELVRFFMKVLKLDTGLLGAISVWDWVHREIRDPRVRTFILANCRAVSYTRDPEQQLAGPVIDQLKRAAKSWVLYVNGGWQTIVDQLRDKAVQAGADILYHKQVAEIGHNENVQRLAFADGTAMDIAHVVCTAGPAEAFRLVPHADQTSLHRWKEQARPSMAACLDLCLKKLPVPKRNVVLGLDTPIFFTNQSAAARLSNNGYQVVHIIKHNGTGGSDPKEDERILERTMDLIQPGWRQEVEARQYLPAMVVYPDYMHRSRADSYPGPAVREIGGLYVAGDWASHGEILSDAAVASGRRAALQILQQTAPRTVSV